MTCNLRVGDESLPQATEVKYLRVLLKSIDWMEAETDQGHIFFNEGVALVCCGAEGAEPRSKAISLLLCIRFTYGHEVWIITERTISQISD